MHLNNHNSCIVFSQLFRGKLCEQLTHRVGRHFEPDEYIYMAGEEARSVYYLRQGLVKTSIVSEEGEELILGVHKPGEVFGELCLCSGERREQALALEPSEIVEITLEHLLNHLRQNSQALTDFLKGVLHHLSGAQVQLQMLAFDKTSERLARTLLKLAEELGKPIPEGVELEHYIKQEDLARMIGASREVASSSLNRLRTLGWVHYSRKGRITVNTEALRTFLVTPNAERVA